MNTIKQACIFTNIFPPYPFPSSGMFLFNLIEQFLRLGIECTVIRPVSLTKRFIKGTALPPEKETVKTHFGDITVYSPRFISFGDATLITSEMSYRSKEKVVLRLFAQLEESFDIVYSHFYTSGRTAKAVHDIHGIPLFSAHGESKFVEQFRRHREKDVKAFFSSCSGIITVSSPIQRHITEKYQIGKEQILVAPNGFNTDLFSPVDKAEAREKLGLDEQKSILVFVGSMIERKGPNRIVKAMNGLENVEAYFIGKKGNDMPEVSSAAHYLGEKPQREIVTYLSAADMFVLPTLAEGSCNAVIEALACGVPVISSDRDFNEDILDDSCAILVDPLSIEEIRDAIIKLHTDRRLREQKSAGALKRAEMLSLSQRAETIVQYMNTMLSAEKGGTSGR